jgi:hypothetical protein
MRNEPITNERLMVVAELTKQGDLDGAARMIDEALAEIERLAAAFRDERQKLHDHRVMRLLEGLAAGSRPSA